MNHEHTLALADPDAAFSSLRAQGALSDWKTSFSHENKTFTHTQKTLGCINKNMKNNNNNKTITTITKRRLAVKLIPRRREGGGGLWKSPNSRRGRLLDCICLLFNVHSLWRTGFKSLTDFIRLILLRTDWNCDFREEPGESGGERIW